MHLATVLQRVATCWVLLAQILKGHIFLATFVNVASAVVV